MDHVSRFSTSLQSFIFILLLVGLAWGTSSCSHLLDNVLNEPPSYVYQVFNNTDRSIRVQYKLLGKNIIGRPFMEETIPAQSTTTLWTVSGDEGEGAMDFEQFQDKLLYFSITSIAHGNQNQGYTASAKNFNFSHLWAFEREKRKKARYTLMVNQQDF